MPRGRKPQPINFALLPGQRRDRINGDQPVPIREMPEPPDHLDAVAVREFRRVVDYLDQMGVLSLTDTDHIALYADVYSRWCRATKHLQAHGDTVTMPNGYQAISPHLKIANECIKQMRGLLSDMGMSPAARTKVNVLPQEDIEEDKWHGML
jgi:P27 family predicted phage terminase small subunit